jgi:hypothetical protein
MSCSIFCIQHIYRSGVVDSAMHNISFLLLASCGGCPLAINPSPSQRRECLP